MLEGTASLPKTNSEWNNHGSELTGLGSLWNSHDREQNDMGG